MPEPAELEQVVAAVLGSRRYRHVQRELVQRVAAAQWEASGGRSADAIKRTKRALHQVFGAYLPKPPRYEKLLRRIDEAGDDGTARRDALRHAMGQHASTRERLDHLDEFYGALRERIEPPRSVLDLACGLNPLAMPWLGWGAGVTYHAWDIDHAMVAFVGAALEHLGADPQPAVVDLLAVPRWPAVDVAFVLKTLPCLEQQRPGASEALLASIEARTVVVTFPTRSLGGRAKGMGQTYASRFEPLLAAAGDRLESFEAGPELVYVIERG